MAQAALDWFRQRPWREAPSRAESLGACPLAFFGKLAPERLHGLLVAADQLHLANRFHHSRGNDDAIRFGNADAENWRLVGIESVLGLAFRIEQLRQRGLDG